ncbi:c-type cytochrome [Flavobacterium acetivorans]|uniref:c-type cytochrome n=1 Tax=Flavobacterium acetivorans TaxID=2893883 RepID=UPI001E37EB70|nr:c-type cytochrome [Flavobacterium sp. F-29]UFH36306.1 c-type cytochrome [Flavobacterium sp. F-29]
MKKNVSLLALFVLICFGSSLTLVSCKKESQESFGKEETNTEAVSEGMQAEKKTPVQLGEQLFNGKGNCASCHQIDVKSIGPSVQEIAKMYKDKNSDMISFLKGNSEPIVDPSQFEVMKANFAITKAMSDEELKALEAYFYSNLK